MSSFAAITLLLLSAAAVSASNIVLTYSPNHSLKPPIDPALLSARFLSTGDLDTTNTDLRLCHHRPHSRAAIWCRHPNPFPDWQLQLVFRVSGDKMSGGEGLAVWYARNLGQAGPVYGGPNRWHGLGVFTDVDGDSNRVMGALSAGDVEWKHEKKGEGQFFGGCLAKLRNTAAPVHMRITYVNRVIKVELDDSKEGGNYASCVERANTDLPPGQFFGVSAATGDVPDTFELLSMEVYQLKRDGTGQAGNPAKHGANQEDKDKVVDKDVGKQLHLLQSNFNAVIGQVMPGDRNVMQRLDVLESQIKALSDRLQNLSDLLAKVVSKSASVDPGALLHTLNDIRESTRQQLHALALKAGAAEQQTQSLAQAIVKPNLATQFWWWLGFVAAQVILLLAYQLVRRRFEEKSKKFI